jgi:hypothetical protein
MAVLRGRDLGLGLLILVDILIYAVVLNQFFGLAQGETSGGPSYATEAALMRLVPTLGIPGVAAVAAVVAYWRAGQKMHVSVLVGAIFAFVADCAAIWGSIPVA